jgi:hypothetical protein
MDAYAVLGVHSSASDAEVREAYLRRSKELHPDRFAGASESERATATRAMQEINIAYAALRDREPLDTATVAPPPPSAPHWQPGAAPPTARRRRWPLLVAAFVIGTVVVGLTAGSGTPPPPDPRAGDDLAGLKGRCITLTASGIFEDVVDCTRPHDARVVEVVAHDAACPLWSDSTLPSAKQDLCLDRVGN